MNEIALREYETALLETAATAPTLTRDGLRDAWQAVQRELSTHPVMSDLRAPGLGRRSALITEILKRGYQSVPGSW